MLAQDIVLLARVKAHSVVVWSRSGKKVENFRFRHAWRTKGTEVLVMAKVVEIPSVIRSAMSSFEDLFVNDPQRRHLAEYLTGLIVAERKSVHGMCLEFAATTDQSCWNRFLREA